MPLAHRTSSHLLHGLPRPPGWRGDRRSSTASMVLSPCADRPQWTVVLPLVPRFGGYRRHASDSFMRGRQEPVPSRTGGQIAACDRNTARGLDRPEQKNGRPRWSRRTKATRHPDSPDPPQFPAAHQIGLSSMVPLSPTLPVSPRNLARLCGSPFPLHCQGCSSFYDTSASGRPQAPPALRAGWGHVSDPLTIWRLAAQRRVDPPAALPGVAAAYLELRQRDRW